MLRIRKIDEHQQIVEGEVYSPGSIDTHGDTMTAEEIAKMAHRFLQNVSLSKSIDAMHDNVPKDAYPVESFIARAGDPDYTAGAWVLAVKVVDPILWQAVKSGEINGYSFEAYVTKTNTVVMVETVPLSLGVTEPDPEDGHVHYFAVKIDDEGKVVDGNTSTTNGHSHQVLRGTATQPALSPDGRIHSHRIIT